MPSKRKTAATATATASDADHGTDASPPSSSVVAAAPVKRQRVSRACDQCRAAREKCDGIQPLCFPCVSQNRACTYAANPKKRGVQTGYIKTLEVALAWLFDKVPGCEDALETLLLHEGGQGQNLLVGKDSHKANRLHKTWRRSKVHKEIDRILSGGLVSQSRADKSSPSDDGDSDNDQSETASRTLPASTPRGGAPQLANGPSSQHPDGYASVDSQLNHGNSNIISLPSNHWRLLDIYFSYTHCWYPILEKQDLLKTVYLYPAGGLDTAHMKPSSAAHAELWAAMALAAYQDASSMSASASAHGHGHGPGPADEPAWSLDQIYRVARRLVPSEEGDFEIQHARALLLLALINVGRGKKTSAWILVGLAHRIALDVSELHRGDERSARRATAVLMGCYILDTLIAVHPRAMPSLETAGIVEGMSIPEDDLDEWQPWAPCDGFGTGAGPRPSFRSPAYSLTTFNQLYDVFKFMRKRTLQRQNSLLPVEHPSEAILLLHQTIKPGLPFAGFIVARDSSSVSIPSAYVLRILFLWVDAILDSTDESPCNLILESVEQYMSQFGACGAPPFFASCLAMVRQHQSFNNLHPQCVERWQVIQDTLASIWNPSTQSNSADSIRPLSAVSKTPIAETPLATAPLSHAAPSVTTSTPSDLYSSSSLHTPPLMTQHFPPRKQQAPPPPSATAAPPFMMNALSPPKAMQNAAAALNPAMAPAGMSILDTPPMMPGGPGPPHPQQHQHQHPHQQPPPPPQSMHAPGGLIHRDSFNAGPLDYDALLDDLSSMDYIDRVDADPQFMANLGFAPGCDISEVLSREFGAI
ncbi:hypothetical protein BD289DRAFT_426250 [Coniella lustricola]|uniref:Zn(2)-C6 fungal-type domain-containing protein n=1 Tax=Coniella lustricola TaxID=2025994 RepID=A0A2T3AG76_9PEZI|nr:hypothetical protein BD289DRAFT_426250 [Coniella lustricola]